MRVTTTVHIEFTTWDGVHIVIPEGTLLFVDAKAGIAVFKNCAFPIDKHEYQINF